MDLIYIGLALVLWLATWALARGCARLLRSGKEPS